MKDNFKSHAFKAYNQLSSKNLSVFWNYKYNLKKSLSKANIDNAKIILIIGEKEYQNNTYTLRYLDSGEQVEIKINEIKNYI